MGRRQSLAAGCVCAFVHRVIHVHILVAASSCVQAGWFCTLLWGCGPPAIRAASQVCGAGVHECTWVCARELSLQGSAEGTGACRWLPWSWEMLQGCFSHRQHRDLSLLGQTGGHPG